MGTILYQFKGLDKPQLHVERRIDRIEKQELHMNFMNGHDSWIATESGDSLHLFCRDEDGNTMEVTLPISIEELKKTLEKYID